ncbi:MAG TPA: site-specific integrase [Saprospiraceae bacterium]|jgi:hypothetical protein|nr:site-specific integrase [Saprospiraceae bacterium]HMT72160.1 site-specific integrase [Saprospiraceae bacterium]
MKSKDDNITAEKLRKKITGTEQESRKKLLEITKIFNEQASKLIGIEIGKITWGRYVTFAQKLGDFIKMKFGVSDIYLFQLKYNFIIEYDFYLKTEIKLHQNTIVKYIQYLNRVMDFAVNNEWVDKNIFQNYKVSINGKKWIYTERKKTENVSNVPLLEPALEIIEKYKDHPICVNRNRLLPMKSNQKLNSYLKELADICGIDKPMTMHIARHTFATTVLLTNGVSMEATSKMLGHKSIKTTQIYGKIVESRVGMEMDNLSNKLFPTKEKDQERQSN